MNQERRRTLQQISTRLESLRAQWAHVQGELESARDDLQSIMEEEEEAFGNLPESLQDGDRGSAMQEAIDEMGSAIGQLDDLVNALESTSIDDLVGSIDGAMA